MRNANRILCAVVVALIPGLVSVGIGLTVTLSVALFVFLSGALVTVWGAALCYPTGTALLAALALLLLSERS